MTMLPTILFLSLIFGLTTPAPGQQSQQLATDQSERDFVAKPSVSKAERVRLTSVINENALKRFLKGEPIVILLPEGSSQSVGAIRLERPEYFKSKPFFARLRSRLVSDTVEILIPPDAFDRLDYQPIEIPIYQSQITTFKLIPDLSEDSTLGLKVKDVEPDFYVRLKPNNGVSVAFPTSKPFRLSNEFISADLSFDDIEGIFFNEGEDRMASVVMRNGDNITGHHDWPNQVTFVTAWGAETISLNEVVSVTRNRSARLVPSGAVSPKWVVEAFDSQLP